MKEKAENGMNNKKLLSVLVSFGLFMTLICINGVQIASPRTIKVPGDFPTIQEAINNATEGDTILVDPNIYHEHLDVNKSVTVSGVNVDTTIIEGDGWGTVVNITSIGVHIDGFTIRNGSTGLYIHSASENNLIRFNKITLNDKGIYIDRSTSNILSHNNIMSNSINFDIEGAVSSDFIQSIDESNTVDGKPIYYWVSQQDKPVPLDAGYVALVNCLNITVKNLSLRKNGQGVLVAWSTNVTMQNLDITDCLTGVSVSSSTNINLKNLTLRYNDKGVLFLCTNESLIEKVTIQGSEEFLGCGIELWISNNNVVFNNTVVNVADGISLWGQPPFVGSCYNVIHGNTLKDNWGGLEIMGNCTGNIIYHNNFIYNMINAVSNEPNNDWDNGAEGNYWWDYIGRGDTDGDGINEDQYNITISGVDRFPLNETWSPTRTIDVTWLADIMGKYYFINILSDHVVASYKIEKPINWTQGIGIITFNITAGSSGYCNITIPRDRLDYPFDLFVNNLPLDPANYNTDLNATHCWLYFTYTNGHHNIKIISHRIGRICGDINGDGIVNMLDIGIACKNFLKPGP